MLKTNAFILSSFFLASLPVFASAQSGTHQHSAQGAWQLTLHPAEGGRPKICLADPQKTSNFKQGEHQARRGISQQQPAYPDEIACQNAVAAGRAGLAMSDNMMYIRQAEGHAYSQVPLYQVAGARVDSVTMAQLSPDSQMMALVFQHQGQSQLNFVHTKSMRPRYQPVTLKMGLQNPKAFIFSKPQPAFANGSTVALAHQPANLGILVGENHMAHVVAVGNSLHIADAPMVRTAAMTKKLRPYQSVTSIRSSDVHHPATKAHTTHQTSSPYMTHTQMGKKLRHAPHVPYTNNSSPYMIQVTSHGTHGEVKNIENPYLHQGHIAPQPRSQPYMLRRSPERKVYPANVLYIFPQSQPVNQSIDRQ